MKWGGVTPFVRHSGCRLLLTTSESPQPVHLKKTALNSFDAKILPVTLTRSRFCGASFRTTQSFQDFRGQTGGRGVTQFSTVVVKLSVDTVVLPNSYPDTAQNQRASASEPPPPKHAPAASLPSSLFSGKFMSIRGSLRCPTLESGEERRAKSGALCLTCSITDTYSFLSLHQVPYESPRPR